MSSISDLYQNLFGKNHIQDGDVISMSQHGRVGGVSTGQGFQYVASIDPTTGLPPTVSLNTSGMSLSISSSIDFSSFPSISGHVLSDQGAAGVVPWLMTLATLSVVTQPGAGALATVTAHQGLAGAIPWLVTMGTLSVVGAGSSGGAVAGGSLSAYVAGGSLTTYQGGLWNVLASLSGSPTVLNAGGSLTAYQGGTAWLVTQATLPVMANIVNSSIPVTQSGAWSIGASISNSLTIQSLPTLSTYQGGAWAVTANAGTNLNTSALALEAGNLASVKTNTDNLNVTLGSRLASGATLPVTGNIGQLGTWTVQPGNTPNTTAWLVTMGTLSVVAASSNGAVAGGSLSSYVAGGSLSAYQGGLWNVLASISGVPTVLASLPSASSFLAAGGSLTAFKNNASNAMTTMVSASATAVTLLAANSARKGASFYNNSSAILYLRNGAGASTSAFKIAMAASSYFEEPADYSGVVSGTWASATGSVAVTEEY